MEIHPNQNDVDRYFMSEWPVQPQGWHQALLQRSAASRNSRIVLGLDEAVAGPREVELRGWAFVKNDPSQPLYLLADYGDPEQLGEPINQRRRDVKRAHKLSTAAVGFNTTLPRNHNNKPLRAVRIGSPNSHAVKIWEDPSADG